MACFYSVYIRIVFFITVDCVTIISPTQVVVLCAGTSNYNNTSEEIYEGILAIVTAIRQKQPEAHIVVVVSIFLYNSSSSTSTNSTTISSATTSTATTSISSGGTSTTNTSNRSKI